MPENKKNAGRKPIPKGQIKWDIKRRFEFIEFHVFWQGPLKRVHLTDNFGISTVQASKDIKTYKGLAPDNLVYDPSTKTYSSSKIFVPLFISIEPSVYLANLTANKKGFFSVETSLPGSFPESEIVPSPYRKIDTKVLRTIIDAIENKKDVEIKYQSMGSPRPIWRWITPHAFNFDGYRWHCRCFCHQSKSYKDFLLARMMEIGDLKKSQIDVSKDLDWVNDIQVTIGPHPDLSDSQSKVITYDYDMEDGVKVITVKKASLFYFYRNMGFNVPENGFSNKMKQIVLINRTEIEDCLNQMQTQGNNTI